MAYIKEPAKPQTGWGKLFEASWREEFKQLIKQLEFERERYEYLADAYEMLREKFDIECGRTPKMARQFHLKDGEGGA